MGAGGNQKTAGGARIYTRDGVKDYFEIRAWIVVPRGRIVAEEILRLTAAQVLRRSSAIRDDLINALRGKRYLIVFDDVWRDELWHAAVSRSL